MPSNPNNSKFKADYFAIIKNVRPQAEPHSLEMSDQLAQLSKLTHSLNKNRTVLSQFGIEHCVENGAGHADTNSIRIKLQCRDEETTNRVHRVLSDHAEDWLIIEKRSPQRIYVRTTRDFPNVDIRHPASDQHDAILECGKRINELQNWVMNIDLSRDGISKV